MTRTKYATGVAEHPPTWQEWLVPIEPDRPCGPDLEYDRAFVLLMNKAVTKTAAQYGDFVDAPPPLNWSEIERDCRQLMLRTKDMRLSLLFTRCRVRHAGAAGLAEGLGLLAAWLHEFSQTLHPCEVEDDDGDAIRDIRSNVLQGLTDSDGLLTDVRDITLIRSSAAPLRVRDVERTFDAGAPVNAVEQEQMRRQLADWKTSQPDMAMALEEAASHLTSIDAWANAQLAHAAPDLFALHAVLRTIRSLGQVGGRNAPDVVAETAGPAEPAEMRADGAYQAAGDPQRPECKINRQVASSMLCDLRNWFEVHEPSSPITVVLRRAERCIGMSYIELTQFLPPDIIGQWEEQDTVDRYGSNS
jgi:type VI secretion system protein ImpA